MNFLFSVEEVFFILHQKNILSYCMQLREKFKELNSVKHFLKHSTFGVILILLFACSFTSYVAEQE